MGGGGGWLFYTLVWDGWMGWVALLYINLGWVDGVGGGIAHYFGMGGWGGGGVSL